MDISIIIPAYNEEKNVVLLHNELKDVLKKIKKTYEMIFIDDGSTDGTLKDLINLNKKDKKVKIIQFNKNFGKSAALDAGFKLAQGNVIFTMDADLQDNPKEIPRFLEAMKKYDLVVGWKYRRKDPLRKKVPSKIANFVTRMATGVKIHDMNCGFKAYRKEAAKNIEVYGEMHRYIPAIVNYKGFKVGEITVHHRSRKYGKSKYGFERLLRGMFDFITIKYLTTYTKRPLHFFGAFGFLFGIIGVLIGFYLSYLKLFEGQLIGNRPILLLSILLIVIGAQFVSIGLIGEMITSATKNQDYLIKKIYK